MLSARAFDGAGHITSTSSDSILVAIDNTPPDVALTSPAQGALIGSSFVLQASARDNWDLKQVEFYDGATLIDTDIRPSSRAVWNTTSTTNGAHTLTAKAYDGAGNVRTSAPVTVTVDRTPPTVALGAPAESAHVRGTVQVSATASDNLAVARVDFYAGSTLLGTDTTSPYAVSWDTSGVADGDFLVTARAYDTAGNVTVSSFHFVTVDNTAPSVALTAPADGASLSWLSLSTTLQASASDNLGVTQVVFYDGGTVLGTDTTAPYSVSWNLVTAAKGTHTLTAKAYDASGNVTTSAPISVKVN
jgi:hypothetical protein